MLRTEKNALKMNLVNGNVNVDGVIGSRYGEGASLLILNARVVSLPEMLAEVMRDAVELSLDAISGEDRGVLRTPASPPPDRTRPTASLGDR